MLAGAAAFLCSGAANGQATAEIPVINKVILEQVAKMPLGGKYAANHLATIRLAGAAHFEQGKFFIVPEGAAPSYCSGATYLVLLKTIEELRRNAGLQLPNAALLELMVHGQKDGEGIWGRWNANGPGTARLFNELGLGSNFTSVAAARPGDFMKIFWTGEVGKNERGHSVIFLGLEEVAGQPQVRFWSSNQPLGYGEKSVPLSSMANVIFSRLERPGNLSRITTAPAIDPYLARLLTTASSFAEVKLKCGM